MKTIRNLAAVLVLTLIPALALAGTSSLVVKDGNGSSQTLSQQTDASNSSYLMGVSTIADPTNGYRATVKNASTAAAAGDPALVVSLSPNNGVGGTAAVGAAAVGSPVQVGGLYNTTPATLTNGQQGSLQTDSTQNLLVRQAALGGNPCANPNSTLVSVAGVTSGTSLTQVIALSGSTKVYICSATVVGTSGSSTPTFKLQTGTGSNCASSTADLTAVTNLSVATPFVPVVYSGLVGPAGNAVCYVQTGTSPVASYMISYVQI